MTDEAAPRLPAELEVTVGPVAHGGICVARHAGRVVFIRHALPGERVRAVVTEGGEDARFLRADAVEVLEASPDRVVAPCPYAGPGRCGGCDWQHAALPAQRRLKAAVVAEQLRRLAGRDVDVVVEELPGAPGGLGWRTRVQFAVDSAGRAGLRRYRSHAVQPLARCLIAHPGVEALGVEAREWAGYDRVEAVASAGTGESALLAVPAGTPRPELVAGTATLTEKAAGRLWRVPAGGFWQVHPAAADTLVAAVVEGLRPTPSDVVLDLYCGVGLFAGALAPHSGQVTGVESAPAAVRAARRNLAGAGNARVVGGRVETTLGQLGVDRVDLVVLDPPRTGAGRRVIEGVAALAPRRVVYVACDPAALARDVAYFAERGYSLDGLRAFDLFPMTHHVECVAVLVSGGA